MGQEPRKIGDEPSEVAGDQASQKPDALTVGIVGGLAVAALTGLLGHLNPLGGLVLGVGCCVGLIVKTARPMQAVREESLGHPVSLGTIVLQLALLYALFLAGAFVVFSLFFD